ncbi:SDR family NAD(P)-dependent oxidoreductase [Streptomyces aureus]|uniref:SDR family NAD(P)-dependent oxidoreductase n=1 Tax=Streptomyces aureus TaxID=193461 RepID=A0ABV4SYJ1_9ACTN
MSRYDGAVVLVTGAASGIGAAVSERLRSEGAAVVRTDVRGQNGVRALDVTDASAWSDTVDDLVSKHGRLDLLVNVAGTTGFAPFDTLDTEEWDRIINVNQRGTYLGMRHVLPTMLRASAGAIVNVASIFSTRAVAGLSAYHASKAAVVGMTSNAAVTYAGKGVRVNAVAPGWIDTPMTAGQPSELNAAFIASTPMQRGGVPDEVAAAVTFLGAPEASYITGVVLPVDGGYLAT